MAGKVIDRDMGYRALLARFREAATRDPHVTVGIHAADAERGKEVSNAEIAVFHEFGTKNMPARPFLAPTMDMNKDKYAKMIELGMGRWIDGTSTMKREFGIIGTIAKGDVQRFITKLKEPRLADSTIAAKGSTNPLIDTGQLRASIDYEVKVK